MHTYSCLLEDIESVQPVDYLIMLPLKQYSISRNYKGFYLRSTVKDVIVWSCLDIVLCLYYHKHRKTLLPYKTSKGIRLPQ